MMDYIHSNLKQLSHSSSLLLHGCPTKYKLMKLGQEVTREKSIHFDFGHMIGNGLQEYLITDSIEKTYWRLFREWSDDLEDERGIKQKKTFYNSLVAVDKFAGLRHSHFGNYSLAVINGKPAVELGFSIDLGGGFHYRGKLDAVLINVLLKELVVLECKSTAMWDVDEAMYKNSGQSLGYSVILDRLAPMLDIKLGSSWNVFYPIYMSKKQEWEVFRFAKNQTSRARWIKNILMDKRLIETCVEDDFFPMHGEHCYSFGKACQFFGTCELTDSAMIGPLDDVPVKVDNPEDYEFKFTIEELIEEQLRRVTT